MCSLLLAWVVLHVAVRQPAQALAQVQAVQARLAQQEPVDEPSVAALALLSRATVYGLARMQHDGHLGQWGVAAGDEAAAMTNTLDLLIALMRSAPSRQ